MYYDFLNNIDEVTNHDCLHIEFLAVVICLSVFMMASGYDSVVCSLVPDGIIEHYDIYTEKA